MEKLKEKLNGKKCIVIPRTKENISKSLDLCEEDGTIQVNIGKKQIRIVKGV